MEALKYESIIFYAMKDSHQETFHSQSVTEVPRQ